MKYLRFNGGPYKLPVFVRFSPQLQHKDVASALQASGLNPVAGGFYDEATGETYGFSSSLDLNPMSDDAMLMQLQNDVCSPPSGGYAAREAAREMVGMDS